jgi:hypothetical protein
VGVLLLIILAASTPAHSAILLSGDSSIGAEIDGNFAPVDPGNKQFFRNVLGTADKVVIFDAGGFTASSINNYYNTLPGVSSTIIRTTISDATFSGGVDLFIVTTRGSYAPPELTAMRSFADRGGNIFLMGEWSGIPARANVNVALQALGTSMRLLDTDVDVLGGAYTRATGDKILPDQYTAGVSSFTYAASSAIDPGDGKILLLGSGYQPLIAYVPEPAVSAFLLAIVLAARGRAWGPGHRARLASCYRGRCRRGSVWQWRGERAGVTAAG